MRSGDLTRERCVWAGMIVIDFVDSSFLLKMIVFLAIL